MAEAAGNWPLPEYPQKRRWLPDLALVQQPIHALKAYFGSKIAFYFAWIEMYTMWLLSLVWIIAGAI